MREAGRILAAFSLFTVAPVKNCKGKLQMIKRKAFRICALAVMGTGISQTPAMAQCGTASWYHEGAVTANGERYRPDGISAAHKSLPFGARVKVTHQRTGRSVVVRINDRGPFIRGRIIDLSRGAKRVLGMGGLAPVCLTVLGRGQRVASAKAAGKHVAAKRTASSRRVAAKSRKARSRLVARTAYGTTQTGARAERAERVRKRHSRVVKRANAAKLARQDRRTDRYAENRRPEPRPFKLAGWPRSNDPTF
jgi:rare lipoprotein A